MQEFFFPSCGEAETPFKPNDSNWNWWSAFSGRARSPYQAHPSTPSNTTHPASRPFLPRLHTHSSHCICPSPLKHHRDRLTQMWSQSLTFNRYLPDIRTLGTLGISTSFARAGIGCCLSLGVWDGPLWSTYWLWGIHPFAALGFLAFEGSSRPMSTGIWDESHSPF